MLPEGNAPLHCATRFALGSSREGSSVKMGGITRTSGTSSLISASVACNNSIVGKETLCSVACDAAGLKLDRNSDGTNTFYRLS